MRLISRFLVLVVLTTAPAFAANHPEIKWQSVPTKHFLINYYPATEPAVYPVAKIAEEAYDNLSSIYGFNFRERININLIDYDDISNGYADPISNTISILVPDIEFDFRGNTLWLRNVVAHELTHILSLSQYGAQWYDWQFGASYEGSQSDAAIAMPLPLMQQYPSWFSEGLAQIGAEQMHSDRFDSRREMLLRCGILENKELSLDAMATFNHTPLGNENVYNQGFGFTRFLRDRYGISVLAKITNLHRSPAFGVQTMRSAFEQVTHHSLDAEYSAWISSSKEAFLKAIPQEPTPETSLFSQGIFNLKPRVSSDAKLLGFLSSAGGDDGQTDLLIMRLSDKKITHHIPYATAAWCFSSDSKTIYFVKLRDPNSQGSYLNDLCAYSLSSNTIRRITHNARIYDCIATNNPDTLITIRFLKGAYSLAQTAISTGTTVVLIQGTVGSPFKGLAFDAVNNAIITSKIEHGNADICRISLSTKESTVLVASPFSEESPALGSDGRLYFSADYNGIFNIYSTDLTGADLRCHSAVVGGLFNPQRHADKIFCSSYRARGLSIISIDTLGAAFTIPASDTVRVLDLPAPSGPVSIRSTPYKARQLKPVWEGQTFYSLYDYSNKIGRSFNNGLTSFFDSIGGELYLRASTMSSDALGKSSQQVSFGCFLTNKALSYYRYNGFSGALQSIRQEAPLSKEIKISQSPQERLRSALKHDLSQFTKTHNTPLAATTPNFTIPLNAPKIDSNPENRQENMQSPPLVAFANFYGVNTFAAPTFSLNATLVLPAFIPLFLSLNPSIDLELGRATNLMLSPSIDLFLARYIQTSFPFQVNWLNIGHTTTDISYTLADVTALSGVAETGSTSYFNDTLAQDYNLASSRIGLLALHGFRLPYSSSFVLRGSGNVNWFSRPVSDNFNYVLDNALTWWKVSESNTFNFPLARAINKGEKFYADAVYGQVGYGLELYGDGHYPLNLHANDFTRYNPDALHGFVEHVVTAGVTFGFTNSYAFNQQAQVLFSYSILRQKGYLSASIGF